MTNRFILGSALVLLLTVLVLTTTPSMTHAFSPMSADIMIDGEFEDWSNGDGNENCQIDVGGATDINIYYQYELDGGAPIERRAYYWDINKQCFSSNEADTLYILQTAYREFLVPYNWDTYDYQTICTLINTDPSVDPHYNFALCTDINVVYCHGPNPSCVETYYTKLQLMRCNDTSSEQCTNPTAIKTYPGSSYENGVGNEMTFQVWVSGNLRSFFDDMTEIAIPFDDLNVNQGSNICLNTASFIFEWDEVFRDKILNTFEDYCINLGGTVPTSVELASNQVETAGLSAPTFTILVVAITLTTMPGVVSVVRRKERRIER